ncbi:DNA replication licensing factor mcm10 [Chaetomidium leptoderma]|uniref:DNA replication licensing factor mcm10 n=1 Tax=Chaetomidium leptoderma TaxID=669021 RepID=A0AAN7A2V8_9PEZI|nr:DNA replication licensing factor mcm10 [Chaetomidium leptoderma]
MAAQWPPRSPHEALLSTPGGREKLRRLAERTSPSPSPSRLRTSRSISALASRPRTGPGGGEDELFEGGGDFEEEEEDEETLQLKLEAIQARLRLKKLQAAKAQRRAAATPAAVPGNGVGMRAVPLQSQLAAVRDRLDRQASRDVVQVPASPVRKSHTTDLQTSPQRVLLGIDKGLRGADMSLKRAPSRAAANESRQGQQGGWLRRAKSPPLGGQLQLGPPAPLSFNERLASARTEEVARQEKRERVQNARSAAFSVGREEMEDYKTKALDLPDLPSKPQGFSREQVLSSMGRPSGGQLQRSNTVPSVRPESQIGAASDPFSTSTTDPTGDSEGAFEPYSGLHLSKRILPHNVLARAVSGKKAYLLKDLLRQVKAPEWSLPDDETDIVVFAIVASKSDPRSHRPGPGNDGKAQQDRGKYMVLTLVDLTYEVELFLFNSGFDRFWKLTPGTVLAILNPGILPPPPGREATNRFGLVINSDEDTILEIGKARDIGYCKSIKKDGAPCKSWVNARRTEYCEFHTNEAVRKARSSRIELSTTAGLGTGDGPRGRNNSRQVFAKSEEERKRGHYDRATQSQYFISTAHRATDVDDERITGMADRREREEGLKRRLAQKEKERDIARRLGEMGGGAGKEYMNRAATAATRAATPGTARPTLGSSFSSAATSSFSSAAPVSSAATSATSIGTSTAVATTTGHVLEPPRKWDARALGLVGRRGADQPKISLGAAPSKRKRPESSGSTTSAAAAAAAGGYNNNNSNNNSNVKKAPLGWGSVLSNKLGRMKEGERLDGRTMRALESTAALAPAPTMSAAPNGSGFGGGGGGGGGGGVAARRGDKSPVRKKTRFVTDKGIREAGRESLGEPLSAALKTRRQVVLDDDDDDDLIIVK